MRLRPAFEHHLHPLLHASQIAVQDKLRLGFTCRSMAGIDVKFTAVLGVPTPLKGRQNGFVADLYSDVQCIFQLAIADPKARLEILFVQRRRPELSQL